MDHIHTTKLVYHSLLSILVEATWNWLQSSYCYVEALAYQTLVNHGQVMVLFLGGTLVYHTYLVFLLLQHHICKLFFFRILHPLIFGCIHKNQKIVEIQKLDFF